jgi:hypothetical protein
MRPDGGDPVKGWRADGGITTSGDSPAEDQVGDFCVVRFRHPRLPRAVVTCKSYAYTGVPAVPGVFYVATEIELLTCTDPARPGETATWHEIDREEEDGTWPTETAAQQAARDAAEAWLQAAGSVDWDGELH